MLDIHEEWVVKPPGRTRDGVRDGGVEMRWPLGIAPALSPTYQDALELGDDLVQTLTIAKYALCVGDTAQAMEAIDSALADARRAITELVEATTDAAEPLPGSVVRRTAASRNLPAQQGPRLRQSS
jgi:hypothetical protein